MDGQTDVTTKYTNTRNKRSDGLTVLPLKEMLLLCAIAGSRLPSLGLSVF